jgi:hypothetical protein
VHTGADPANSDRLNMLTRNDMTKPFQVEGSLRDRTGHTDDAFEIP